jgi:hypothetical protein
MTPMAAGAKGLFVQFECREFVTLEQLRDIGAAVKVAKSGARSDSCRYAVVGVIGINKPVELRPSTPATTGSAARGPTKSSAFQGLNCGGLSNNPYRGRVQSVHVNPGEMSSVAVYHNSHSCSHRRDSTPRTYIFDVLAMDLSDSSLHIRLHTATTALALALTDQPTH